MTPVVGKAVPLANAPALPAAAPRPLAGESPRRRAVRRFLRRPASVVALCTLLLILGASAGASLVAPYDPVAINFSQRMQPPALAGGTAAYFLGTDSNGRDLLSRILYGGRVSLAVAFSASTISLTIGITVGLLAGWFGGVLDRIVMRLSDVWLAFPFLVLAIAVISVVGRDLPVLIVLLSFAGWVYPARLTRVQTMQVAKTEFVQAAISLGAGHAHIIRQHIFPNVLTVNIILWTFSIGTLILVESALSFLGLGVRPPTPSWGNILSEGRNYMTTGEWWLSIMPGLAITLTVLCVNAIGDGLQEALDTRIQQR
jgi:peptide/nickel transport system permease protein